MGNLFDDEVTNTVAFVSPCGQVLDVTAEYSSKVNSCSGPSESSITFKMSLNCLGWFRRHFKPTLLFRIRWLLFSNRSILVVAQRTELESFNPQAVGPQSYRFSSPQKFH
jgi:hypothetical protein